MWTKRAKNALAILAIGDGVMQILAPQECQRLWMVGPAWLSKAMGIGWLAKNPRYTLYVILRSRVLGGQPMRQRIRPFEDRDTEAVVDFSLRAWAPVFASLERVLGSEIFGRLHPDWREDQWRAVEEALAASKERVWVAEVDGIAVGFVATDVSESERSMGEISMLAVDSDHQGGGIGTALTKFALERLKEAGMKVAVVETGGDPGHAAARRTYEKAGYTLLPIARYFKDL